MKKVSSHEDRSNELSNKDCYFDNKNWMNKNWKLNKRKEIEHQLKMSRIGGMDIRANWLHQTMDSITIDLNCLGVNYSDLP